MSQKSYWDKKILAWERSTYKKKTQGLNLVEKLATRWRRSNRERAKLTLEILKKEVRNKRVLELGCGSGLVAFKLLGLGQPKEIMGIDIAPEAISLAQERTRQRGAEGKMKFIAADVRQIILPPCDICFGLGFLNYLTLKEIKSLFQKLKAKNILFSFAKKELSMMRLLHKIYTQFSRCPGHYFYTREAIKEALGPKYQEITFIEDKKLAFDCIFHNFA